MTNEPTDLLAAVTAIGRAVQETFDPGRFLAEFSAQVQRLLPHDRLIIAYLEEGGSLSIFAEHALRGPLLHEGRYTIAFDPGGRYTPAELTLEPVLAGEAMWVRDFQNDPRVRPVGSRAAQGSEDRPAVADRGPAPQRRADRRSAPRGKLHAGQRTRRPTSPRPGRWPT